MAKLTDVPFALQEGEGGVPQNSNETLVNMFCEIALTGRSKLVRRQRPGLRSVYALSGTKRAIEKFVGGHYLIVDDLFYSFDGAILTALGTLSSTSGLCSMIQNDNGEILISDNAQLYYWNGTTLGSVTTTATFTPGRVSYLNGYGIVNSVGTDQFFITPANDFSQIDALDFATAESSPDALVGTFVDHNEIWLPGTDTIEIWQDVGGTDFPFQAATAAKIERGVMAPFSMAADDNTVVFYGNDGIVYRSEGYRPVRISTHPVEALLLATADKASARGFIYTIGGHKFYTLSLPGLTLQYNFATGLWNRAKTYDYDDWRVWSSAGRNSDYVLTDYGISELTFDVNTDDGGITVRTLVSSPGWAGGNRIIMDALIVDLEVGRTQSPTDDPQIMLRVARDGETFGNVLTRTIGTQGNYKKRVVWRGLGWGRKPVLELSMSDDASLSIMGIQLLTSIAES